MKNKIIQKAMRLVRDGERIGFMVEDGKGDYTLYPMRSRADFRRLSKRYMRDDNFKVVTLELCGGDDYGREEITD